MSQVKKIIILLWVISMAACSSSRSIIPLEDSAIERAVTNYLLCVECINGELQQVQILGPSALSYLEDIVEYGAPQQIISLAYLDYKVTAQKISLWHKQNALELANIDPLISAKQIDFLMRTRAVEAISAIGGNKGIKILERLTDIVSDGKLLQAINFAIQNPQFYSPSFFQADETILNTN